MKKLILLILIITTFVLFGEERPIYIGDIIKIRIAGDINEDTIKNSFAQFEIKSMTKKEDGSFEVEFFSMEPCDKTVKIGEKEIKIKVTSLVNGDEKEIIDITTEKGIDGKRIPKYLEPKAVFPLTAIVILAVIAVIAVFTVFIYKKTSVKKKKQLTPIEVFEKEAVKAKGSYEQIFFMLTVAFKEYFYAQYGVKISGKTSQEIIDEIINKNIRMTVDINELKQWLVYSDMIKFAGLTPSDSKALEMQNILKEIVRKDAGGRNV